MTASRPTAAASAGPLSADPLDGHGFPVIATYFPCLFRIGEADCYVIWYSNEQDGLVRENGRLVLFASPQELLTYAGTHGLELQAAEPARYDWDVLASWCDNPVANEMMVGPFLNAWNMLLDAHRTDDAAGLFLHAHERAEALYDKLFRANNLPAMTPPGAEYEPVWTKAELTTLAQLLRLGIVELRRQVRHREAV